MLFSNKSLINILLASSLVLGGTTTKLGSDTAIALQNSSSSSQSNSNHLKVSLFQTDNKAFTTRIEALNAVKDRGLVPTSQSFISQWENGNDTSKARSSNYVLEKTRQASWGNYYVYKVGTKYFVVAEHINDPDAPCPKDWTKPCKHFHVGTAEKNNTSFLQSKIPDAAAIEFFKSKDYDQVGTSHHYFYKSN
jgi:hypothetical protein